MKPQIILGIAFNDSVRDFMKLPTVEGFQETSDFWSLSNRLGCDHLT